VTIGIAAMCEGGDTFVLGADVRATYGRSPVPPSDECGKMYDVPPFDLISCIAGSVSQTEAIFSEFCNQMQTHAIKKTKIRFEHVRNAFEFARKKELRRLQECKFAAKLPVSLYDWMAGKLPDGKPLDRMAFDYGRILLQEVENSFENGLIVAGFADGERIFLKGYKTRPVEEASSPHIHVIGYQPAALEAMKLLTLRHQNIDMTLPRTLFHVHEAMLTARKFGNKMVGMPAAYSIIRDRSAKRPNGVSRFHADSPLLKDWLRAYKKRADTWALDTGLAEIMVRNQTRVHTPRKANRNLTDTTD
jgi:hypothetical protein